MLPSMMLCALLVSADPVEAARPNPQIEIDKAVADAGRKIRVRSLLTGVQDPVLQALANEQARYCAAHGLGHQLFDQQFSRWSGQYPNLRSIAAQSWPGQDRLAAADDLYVSWRQSSGHWAICNGPCRRWGYSMVQAPNGTWYGIGFCSD